MKRSRILVLATITLMAGLAIFVISFDIPDTLHFPAKAAFLILALSLLCGWSLTKWHKRQPARTIAINVGLIAVSIGFSLLAAEILVRLIFRDVTTTNDNSSYFAERWRRANPPMSNRFGFREREFASERSQDVYRIAVIGDSFTYGQGIAVEDRLTEIMERYLNRSGARYEVLNFGQPGAETVDHVNILRDIVLAIQPDFVLLQWFINDVNGGNINSNPLPWRLLPSDTLTSFLHRRSALYYVVNQQWLNLQRRLGFTENYQTYMIRRFRDPDSAASRSAQDALEQFFELGQESGVPMGMALFPQLTSGLLEDYPFAFLIDRVLDTCRQYDVTCIDLRSVFANVSPPNLLWANHLDSHPGPLANRLAAESVLETFEPVWHASLTARQTRGEMPNDTFGSSDSAKK